MTQNRGCQVLCVTHNLAFQQICSSVVQVSLTVLHCILAAIQLVAQRACSDVVAILWRSGCKQSLCMMMLPQSACSKNCNEFPCCHCEMSSLLLVCCQLLTKTCACNCTQRCQRACHRACVLLICNKLFAGQVTKNENGATVLQDSGSV